MKLKNLLRKGYLPILEALPQFLEPDAIMGGLYANRSPSKGYLTKTFEKRLEFVLSLEFAMGFAECQCALELPEE